MNILWTHESGIDPTLAHECLLRDGISQRSIDLILDNYIASTTTYYKQSPIGFSYICPIQTQDSNYTLVFGGSAHLHSLPNRFKYALLNCRTTISHVPRETLYAAVERKNLNVLLTLERLGFKILEQTVEDHELILIREPNHG